MSQPDPPFAGSQEKRTRWLERWSQRIDRFLEQLRNRVAALEQGQMFAGPQNPSSGGGGGAPSIFAKVTAASSAPTSGAFGQGIATLCDPTAYPSKSYTGSSVTFLSANSPTPAGAEVLLSPIGGGLYAVVVEAC